MPKFDFTGSTETWFPDIVTGAGSLVCRPGDTFIELEDDPGTPLLVPSAGEPPPPPPEDDTPSSDEHDQQNESPDPTEGD